MSDILFDPPQDANAENGTGTGPVIDLGPAQPQTSPAPNAGGDVIVDSDTDNFMADVIEASQQVPVIVDFWAPWCGPCKTLGPMLEKLVKRAGGLVKMVKINVDENQALAQQLRVQSVPTVFAFKDGRPVDAFAGAQPETQIASFIERLIGDAKPPLELAMEQALALLDDGQAEQAEEAYSAILEQDATFVPALGGVIRAIAAQGDFARAHDIINALDAKTRTNVDVEQAVSALALAEHSATADTGHMDELAAQVDAAPKDLDKRLDYANALIAANRFDDAVDQLLSIVAQDRNWNDAAGRKHLLQIFDTLGGASPITQDGRQRLSTILFS